jgi:hypothetical protein
VRAGAFAFAYALCVTLISDPQQPRLDSSWMEPDTARARRREIVSEGWVRPSDEDSSEKDESGR